MVNGISFSSDLFVMSEKLVEFSWNILTKFLYYTFDVFAYLWKKSNLLKGEKEKKGFFRLKTLGDQEPFL